MPDIGDSPTTGKPDRDVVVHIVRRMKRDPDLAYQIGFGTTVFEGLVAAQVAATGASKTDVERGLLCADRTAPQIPTLRKRVAELEELLDRLAPDWRTGA